MPLHDFNELYAKYPDIIAQMPPVFTSHEFILELARRNQRLYIEALYSYRAEGRPFNIVHARLARYLGKQAHLVRMLTRHLPSSNILGQTAVCAQWEKLPYRAPHGS